MYLICPRCKKLIDENEEECPYCGLRFPPKLPEDPLLSRQWWCNYCEMYVDPIKGSSPVSFNEFWLYLSEGLKGNLDSTFSLSELSSRKKLKISKNPKNHKCPKCGGNDLQKWKPTRIKTKDQQALKTLQLRFAKGEITKSKYLEMKKLIQEE